MSRISIGILCIAALGVMACGDDASSADVDGSVTTTDGSTPDAAPVTCDYRASDRIAVIEAENLPITEDWRTGTDGDASAGSYIEWSGAARNNNTEFGRFEIELEIETPGLYRLQWRNRVGMGNNATEHNDTWVQFPDADEFYGRAGPDGMEDRVYPSPLCDDTAFIDMVQALPEVAEASCPNGSTRDGYFKVYSSGALDWRWSTRTSDNDAHDIFMRFDAAGAYTMQVAARGDFHQIDRIVIHDATLPDAQVQDPALAETPCR